MLTESILCRTQKVYVVLIRNHDCPRGFETQETNYISVVNVCTYFYGHLIIIYVLMHQSLFAPLLYRSELNMRLFHLVSLYLRMSRVHFSLS